MRKCWAIFLMLTFGHRLSLLWNAVSAVVKLLAPFRSNLLVASSGRDIYRVTSPKTEGAKGIQHIPSFISDFSVADIFPAGYDKISLSFSSFLENAHATSMQRRVNVLNCSCPQCLISCDYAVMRTHRQCVKHPRELVHLLSASTNILTFFLRLG